MEKEMLQKLMFLIEKARYHQNDYFRRKKDVDLKLSKVAEHNLDEYIKLLKRKGYVPQDTKPDLSQGKLI